MTEAGTVAYRFLHAHHPERGTGTAPAGAVRHRAPGAADRRGRGRAGRGRPARPDHSGGPSAAGAPGARPGRLPAAGRRAGGAGLAVAVPGPGAGGGHGHQRALLRPRLPVRAGLAGPDRGLLDGGDRRGPAGRLGDRVRGAGRLLRPGAGVRPGGAGGQRARGDRPSRVAAGRPGRGRDRPGRPPAPPGGRAEPGRGGEAAGRGGAHADRPRAARRARPQHLAHQRPPCT
jgi:hypothetical protein